MTSGRHRCQLNLICDLVMGNVLDMKNDLKCFSLMSSHSLDQARKAKETSYPRRPSWPSLIIQM